MHGLGRSTPPVLLLGRIMLSRGIHILMSENIRHEIDIAGFPVKRSAIGTAQLVGRDFFQIRHKMRIFFNHQLHSPDTDTFFLQGQEAWGLSFILGDHYNDTPDSYGR